MAIDDTIEAFGLQYMQDGSELPKPTLAVEPHTVYVDDSGTDKNARIVVAAFCVSPGKRWKKFASAWLAMSQEAGFDHFHMTEFAGCRKGKWCRDCTNGDKDEKDHPWREWSNTKRKWVLAELVKIICKHVEYGCGIAFAKEDLRKVVIESRLKDIAPYKIPQEYFTHGVQACGGALAKWRAKVDRFPRMRFVFDLTPDVQKDEMATAFLGKQCKPQFINGVEQWFDVDPLKGVSYESRKDTVQLLSADMLAWVTAKIRAAQLFGRGWSKDAKMVAFRFVDSGNLNIGFNATEQVQEWLQGEIAYLTARNVEEASNEANED